MATKENFDERNEEKAMIHLLEQNSQGKSAEVTTLPIFFIFMVTMNILLLAFCIACTAVWKQEINNLTQVETNSLCLPCNQLKLHNDDDWSNLIPFTRESENGVDICCADNEEELDKLVYIFVERQYRLERANENAIPNCLSRIQNRYPDHDTPLARVSGIVRTPRDNNSYKIHWDETSDNSFVSPYIEYHDGEFFIRVSGYYHIYSQVTFSNKGETERQSSTRHWIYRKKKNAPKHSQSSLISSESSKCLVKSSVKSRASSYIGSVVYLDKGDQLGVKISDKNSVTTTSYNNFFGLHRI